MAVKKIKLGRVKGDTGDKGNNLSVGNITYKDVKGNIVDKPVSDGINELEIKEIDSFGNIESKKILPIANGVKGDTSTIKIGSVKSIPSNESAEVTNTGDEHNATFNFKIPRGVNAGISDTHTANIEVINSTESPSVLVTASGEDTSKQFNFDFKLPGPSASFLIDDDTATDITTYSSNNIENKLTDVLNKTGKVKTVDGVSPDKDGNIVSKAVETVTTLPASKKDKVYIKSATSTEKKKVYAKDTELVTKEQLDATTEFDLLNKTVFGSDANSLNVPGVYKTVRFVNGPITASEEGVLIHSEQSKFVRHQFFISKEGGVYVRASSGNSSTGLKWSNWEKLATKGDLTEFVKADDFTRIFSGEGRNLLDVLGVSTLAQAGAALKAKSDAKDYTGLMLGDYLDITSDYGETFGNLTVRYEIVGMNHYDAFVDGTNIVYGKGNITFLATRCVCNRVINKTFIKQYSISSMKSWLNEAVYKGLRSVLGVDFKHIFNYQQFNNENYDNPDWCNDMDYDGENSDYFASDYVYLPSIRELFGSSELGCPLWDNAKQFAIMSLVPSKACMKSLNGNQIWGWTRTPSRHPALFCIVSNYGASYSHVYNSAYGVRPAFNL